MRTTRLINRIIFGIIIFVDFLVLCDEMETFTTAQFLWAKALAVFVGWCTWKYIRILNEENRI